jgi:hypothetical protein
VAGVLAQRSIDNLAETEEGKGELRTLSYLPSRVYAKRRRVAADALIPGSSRATNLTPDAKTPTPVVHGPSS